MRLFFILGLVFSLLGCSEPSSEAVIDGGYADTSRNALDWAGVYQGRLPCADCDAIETELILLPDGQYHLKTHYVGRSEDWHHQAGPFVWDDQGQVVTLKGQDSAGRAFFVGENTLWQLDADGNRIKGNLAEHYQLHKDSALSEMVALYATPWRLLRLNGEVVASTERPIFIAFEPVFASEEAEATGIRSEGESRIYGFSGCNRFFGMMDTKALPSEAASAVDSQMLEVVFSKIGMTRMACDGEILETPFMQALQATQVLQLSSVELALKTTSGHPLALFKADASLKTE